MARLLWAAMLLALSNGLALADEFTFRRVGVPAGSSSDRITVQIGTGTPSHRFASARPIEEQPTEADSAPTSPKGYPAARMAGVDWFWDDVSPLLSEAHLGRLDQAFAVIADAPLGEILPAEHQALEKLAQLYGPDILRLTAGTSVSPDMVLAVIAVESAGRPQAVSHAGAAGLMQLMPATAARFDVADRLEPAESIRGGVAYLDWLLNHFAHDPILALAAYNAGEGAVENSGGVPPYAETRAYVPKVLATWAVARDLCKPPTEAAGSNCLLMVAGL